MSIYINIMRSALVLLIIYSTSLVNAFMPTPNIFMKSLDNKSMNFNTCNTRPSRKVIFDALTVLRSYIENDKSKRWEPPVGYVPDRIKNCKITDKIDKDIEMLFDDDALFTDIGNESIYINKKFDKLLNDIDNMRNMVENIKMHNDIIYTKTKYSNID